MRKIYVLLAACLMAATFSQAQFRMPVSRLKGSRQQQISEIRQRFFSMIAQKSAAINVQEKGTSGARLSAQASYDYVNGGGITDSLAVAYSGNHGSAFDFDNLAYDFGNSNDFPGFNGGGASYVQYDSLTDYAYSPFLNTYTAGRRIYGSNGQISMSDQIGQNYTDRTLFTYNAQGRLTKSVLITYDATNMQWDSSSRDFYTYNAAGYLLRDSAESYDDQSMSWESNYIIAYTNNSAGFPTSFTYGLSFGGFSYVFIKVDVTYTATNKILTDVVKQNNGTILVNAAKDTFGYTNNARTFLNDYAWDTLAHVWVITSQERRHLNSSSLPDSVWTRADNSGTGTGLFDTSIQKLAYNTDGNPTTRRYYLPGVAQVQSEDRWYYGITSGIAGPGVSAAHITTVYPNPATEGLVVRSTALNTIGSWQYRIISSAGSLVAQGGMNAGAVVPVSSLATGLYLLQVSDEQGVTEKTTFIKK